MGITVVVGGQFGSEGKGKTTSLLAREFGEKCAVVRCGGPNSGHITYEHGKEYCLRLLPSGVVYGRRLFLAPAAVVDVKVLYDEKEIKFRWEMQEREIEHREKYTGGNGYYLGFDRYSGWNVSKTGVGYGSDAGTPSRDLCITLANRHDHLTKGKAAPPALKAPPEPKGTEEAAPVEEQPAPSSSYRA